MNSSPMKDRTDVYEAESSQSFRLQHIIRSGVLYPQQNRTPHTPGARSKFCRERLEKYDTKHGISHHGLASVLEDIILFNTESLETFNPSYNDAEQQLTASLDHFQTQVEKLQALREHAYQLVTAFQQQLAASEGELDGDLARLQKWNAPLQRVETMQERVAQLKEVLSSRKDKLAKIDEELKHCEEMGRERRQPAAGGLALAVFIVFIVYYCLWQLVQYFL